MNIKVEFGRLNQHDDSSVLIKEKKTDDGSVIKHIYQRKNIESIKNPFEQIRLKVKYGVEDFLSKNDKPSPLLEKLGFKKVTSLPSDNHARNIIKIKELTEPCAMFEITPPDKSLRALAGILGNDSDGKDLQVMVSLKNYSDSNFLSDFINAFSKEEIFSGSGLNQLEQTTLVNYFNKFSTEPNHKQNIIKDEDQFTEYLRNRKTARDIIVRQTENSKSNRSQKEAFLKKFDEVFPAEFEKVFRQDAISFEIWRCVKGPTQSAGGVGKPDYEEKAVEKNINLAFSKKWWVTKHQKYEAIEAIKTYCKKQDIELPWVASRYLGQVTAPRGKTTKS